MRIRFSCTFRAVEREATAQEVSKTTFHRQRWLQLGGAVHFTCFYASPSDEPFLLLLQSSSLLRHFAVLASHRRKDCAKIPFESDRTDFVLLLRRFCRRKRILIFSAFCHGLLALQQLEAGAEDCYVHSLPPYRSSSSRLPFVHLPPLPSPFLSLILALHSLLSQRRLRVLVGLSSPP
jgi:hypothetical protein